MNKSNSLVRSIVGVEIWKTCKVTQQLSLLARKSRNSTQKGEIGLRSILFPPIFEPSDFDISNRTRAYP